MGTRRSRHNKGRKPVYKDHRAVAAHLLERPCFWKGMWANTRTWWSDLERFKLEVLCEADSDVEACADVLGRSPTSIAWHARDRGITLPSQWARLIAPKRKRSPVLASRRIDLAYPYITQARPEHADIIAINATIPKSIPDHMRADICQEIMLAILEGRTTLDVLRSRNKSSAYFVRKFWNDNYEQAGHALSFGAVDDDSRSYDEAASAVAAKDWYHENVIGERQRFAGGLKTFTPPDQFEAAWRDQIGRLQIKHHELGQFLSIEEIEELSNGDDR